MKRILVTGADGFIGKHLCSSLLSRGFAVRGAVCFALKCGNAVSGIDVVDIPPIGPDTDWTEVLDGVDAVVHLAARVHVMKDQAVDSIYEYRHVNTYGTRRLAECAAKSGVQKLIYISTIKVNGEGSEYPYSECDEPKPIDPYAISKYEAEQILGEISAKYGLEVVIIRPPLVYGPGVKANFLRLMRLISKGFPLPFGNINNKRSLVNVDNLTDAIMITLNSKLSNYETFIVSDDQHVSTPQLIDIIASCFSVKPRLLPIPAILLKCLGKVMGNDTSRLINSLYVENKKIKNRLNWNPPRTINEGIKSTVEWYKSL